MLYDITSSDSFFYDMKSYIEELNRKLGLADKVLAIAGNKCDLEDKRQVSEGVGLLGLA